MKGQHMEQFDPSAFYTLRPPVSIALTSPTDKVQLVLRGDSVTDIDGETEPILKMLALLDGSRSPRDIASDISTEFGVKMEDTLGVITHLYDENYLYNKARNVSWRTKRYSRQMSYFSLFAKDEHSVVDAQNKLSNAVVSIIGVGGVGALAASLLARAGVGTLRLIDGDIVEESNLNRQILYDESSVGKTKVEVAAARLREANSQVVIYPMISEVHKVDEIAELVIGSDLILSSADTPTGQIIDVVNRAAVATKIPLLFAGYIGDTGMLGPMIVPGKTPCLACARIMHDDTEEKLLDIDVEHGLLRSLRERYITPSFGPLCSIMASMAAREAIHWLAHLPSPISLSTRVVLDLRNGSLIRHRAVSHESCRVCQASPNAVIKS